MFNKLFEREQSMEHTAEKRKEVKEKFAKQIREAFLRPGDDYIFGGYVRDTIAGDEYRDIDIFLPGYDSHRAKRDFLSNLQNVFGYSNVRSQGDRNCYHGNVSLRKTRVEVRQEGYWIAIDLVSGEDSAEPFGTLDADVNALYMRSNGIICATQSLDHYQIIENIKAKRFVPYTSDPVRLGKLTRKGYQAINVEDNMDEMSRLHKKIVMQACAWARESLHLIPKEELRPLKAIETAELWCVGKASLQEVIDARPAWAAATPATRAAAWGAWAAWAAAAVRAAPVARAEAIDWAASSKGYSAQALGKDFTIAYNEAKAELELLVKEKENNIRVVEEKKNMSTEKNMGVIETFKSDAGDAGYRIAAKQISKGARSGLLALMRAKGAKRSWIKAVSEMMETEGGLAAISVALGWAMKYVPGLKDDTRAIALSKEFRVEGMAMGGNLLVDEAAEYFLPILMQIKNLPEPPKVRVSDTQSAVRISTAEVTGSPEVVTDECEEDEPVSAPRAQTACQ